MDIIRNADGTLVVPAEPERRDETDHGMDAASVGADGDTTDANATPATRLLRPGEGGYDEALAEWDVQQHPDRGPAVSTAAGREGAVTLVRAIVTSPDHAVAPALEALEDADATGEALRHVLVGGVHSVEDFAAEVAGAGGDPLPAHQATKIIGEVLAELDGAG